MSSGFVTENSQRDIYPDPDNELTLSVERKLKRDAARLALRTMKQNFDLIEVQVQIPSHLVESFFKILSDLYKGYPTARSLEKCNVHTFPDPPIDHLILVFDYAADWAIPLKEGMKNTENEVFEKLISSHALEIENHFKWDNGHGAISIRADKPLNALALAEEFMKINGITEIDLSVPRTKGNDILAKKIAAGWEITYLMQFDVHSSTGAKQHTWRYQCLDSGEIKFIGEHGDEVPDWLACAR